MKGSWVTIDGKNGNGGGGQSSSNKWGGTTSSYPTSGTQGGGYSTSRTSGENQTQNSVVTSNYWGSNALHHWSGGKDAPLYVKAINLGKTDMHDKDAGNLFYVLRDFNFSIIYLPINLEI